MLPEVLKKVITTYDMVSGSFGFSFSFCCPLFTDNTNTLGPKRHQKKTNYHYLKLRDKLAMLVKFCSLSHSPIPFPVGEKNPTDKNVRTQLKKLFDQINTLPLLD